MFGENDVQVVYFRVMLYRVRRVYHVRGELGISIFRFDRA